MFTQGLFRTWINVVDDFDLGVFFCYLLRMFEFKDRGRLLHCLGREAVIYEENLSHFIFWQLLQLKLTRGHSPESKS